ncbi:hypothetical protein [Rathayibacter sp. VKM Ac-2760]|uniref:hypothetical protein n=1 Tax=Rathayibacter sp. VKM Ac-2760 TaxID=2609253 RepID=UPI001315B93B|nr:hypothetical protein [Rathayibacter sp. VKM Ac-2760]QHC58914.1 hypothetical protein GSU72_10400 [Rathayibacter sp. VKM Ac-2760]
MTPATPPRERHVPVLGLTVTVLVAAILLLLGRYALLFLGATEGDVPPAAAIPLPAGSAVVGESAECASGGCWLVVSVRPPDGTTPEELERALGTDPQVRLLGDLWDPRTIRLGSDVRGPLLELRADYWSSAPSP